ncbi:hypothetical protein CL658_04725 [bacterium]|nr:hypothetical protein [bacterium]|tara:strand:- start:3185 stop:3481 length:297 start_codon:yes stop_codon:yes gene_type:complete
MAKDLDLNQEIDDLFEPTQVEKNVQFETLFKCMMPHLNNNYSELVAAHLLLILKLEGVIGDTITKKDMEMIEDMKAKIFDDSDLSKEVLRLIKSIKGI